MIKVTLTSPGQYLNTPNDRHIKFGLSMNGTKQITAEIGLRRDEATSGYIYYPKVYLAYNKTEMANVGGIYGPIIKVIEGYKPILLSGSVRHQEKKGITQWQVNLRVAVTTVSTNVTGYIRKTDSSLAANLTFNYLVKNAKAERARIEFDLKQTSSKGVDDKKGEVKMESSAYPYFNIQGNAKYLVSF